MDSVQHFEIPADNMSRAQTFYSSVFGWHMTPFDGDTVMAWTAPTDENGMIQQAGAINGDISKRRDDFLHPLIVVTVDSIDDKLEQAATNGGKALSDKIAIENMGAYAYVQDSEGNVIGIWETTATS